jgi:SAM-dependent methyltransferase
MSGTLKKLLWSVRHRGLTGTARAAVGSARRRIRRPQAAAPHPFDLAYGTDTGGLIPGSDLASGHASDRHIEGYAAVPPSRFRSIIERWQASHPTYALEQYCFVDVGCGKGRALLLASQAGFREVVGVELNPGLAATARRNVDLGIAAGVVRCPVRVEQKDALEMDWPAGPCVIFLFNPFDAALMEQLAERIAATFRDRPCDLEVLYYKPEQAHAFASDFKLIWCEATGIDAEELAVDPVADVGDRTEAYRLAGRNAK